jgi:hypothetical protein
MNHHFFESVPCNLCGNEVLFPRMGPASDYMDGWRQVIDQPSNCSRCGTLWRIVAAQEVAGQSYEIAATFEPSRQWLAFWRAFIPSTQAGSSKVPIVRQHRIVMLGVRV